MNRLALSVTVALLLISSFLWILTSIVSTWLLIAVVFLGACYVSRLSPAVCQYYAYRIATAVHSLKALYYLDQSHVNEFIESYNLFDQEVCGENEGKSIVNYYRVINYLCSIGEVEKMYIPPVMDLNESIYTNQMLFEEKMIKDLRIKAGDTVLDMGCGRGRVLAHVARVSGAGCCHGLNIDESQLANAKNYAASNNMKQLTFTHGNFNDPLPYPDETFDAVYQIQVLTYTKDKHALFSELYRVLKPGGRLSFLDWVKLDKYNPTDPHHQSIMKKVKPLIGAVDTPSGDELEHYLKQVGFEVTYKGDLSKQPGRIGSQADLILSADKFFRLFTFLVNSFVFLHVVPQHFKTLFDRLVQDCDAFIEGDNMELFTTSWQTLAVKPVE